jgi:hypothetical protein
VVVRIGAVLALVVAIAVVVGCGESPSSSLPPSPTATRDAVAYADPAALYAAIEKAGAPKVEGFGGGTFSGSGNMPAEAEALRGNFMVAISSDRYMFPLSDGTPGASVLAAVFPDASSRKLGAVYGPHMASALGWPSIWVLQGPNWLIWSVDEEALRGIKGAIGGRLGPTPAVIASPGTSA